MVYMENAAKKIQHGNKVNYEKTFFGERVSSQTQGSCYKFYK